MESWSFNFSGKGVVLDDSVSETGVIQEISKTGLMGSELKSPWSYGCNSMESNQGGDQIQEFLDLGSSYDMKKSSPNSFVGKSSDFACEDDSSSMFSSSVVESNARDSSLIDLKLGRVTDQGDVKSFSDSVAKTNFSSSESSVPMKRARAGGLGSQTSYCQVQGCRKDLSSCKDYHKRHKVCEIHSKTTKVIVNGIEKRFCQQCSRFHLLAEFDDGKRSCRKRLAGHNERRRKPHIHIHAGRAGRLFQSSNNIRPEGSSLSTSSFVCQDLLTTRHLIDHNNSSRLVKLEDGTEGLSVMNKRKINENNPYFQDIVDSSFVSRTLFPSYPLGNEDMTVLDSSSTNGGLSDIANSGHALSLLSSQSQCSSLSLVSSGNRSLYALRQPENLLGTTFSSSLLGSGENNDVENRLISDGGGDTIEIDRFLQQSAYMNSKNHFPFQQDPTINLLQLSTQLQQVEHQRQSSMMKHDNDDFSSFGNA